MTASRNLRALDIHPDDLAARLALRNRLVAERLSRNLSRYQATLQLGGQSGSLIGFETKPTASAMLGTYTRIANLYGLSLQLTPVDVPAYDPAGATIYDGFTKDSYRQFAVFSRLIDARIAAGVSTRRLAVLIGIAESGVCMHERLEYEDYNVARWQRYTRALGGRLDLDLVPLEVTS